MSIRDRYNAFIARHEVAWELTFAMLALAFVVTGFIENVAWLLWVDFSITLIFLGEFTTRLAASYNRRAYLRGHWVDAFALVPGFRGFRLLRLLRLLRLVRFFAGMYRVMGQYERVARNRGVALLLFVWLGVVVVSSLAFYAAEVGRNHNVQSPLDALWWGVVTLTTVGYGDVIPQTPEGRLAAIVLMVLGIGLFSAITATVTSALLRPERPDLMVSLAALREARILSQEEYVAKVALVAAANDPGLGEPMSLGSGTHSVSDDD
jgi:voltage-gated potassium channel